MCICMMYMHADDGVSSSWSSLRIALRLRMEMAMIDSIVI